MMRKLLGSLMLLAMATQLVSAEDLQSYVEGLTFRQEGNAGYVIPHTKVNFKLQYLGTYQNATMVSDDHGQFAFHVNLRDAHADTIAIFNLTGQNEYQGRKYEGTKSGIFKVVSSTQTPGELEIVGPSYYSISIFPR